MFKVKATIVDFLGDTERYPCHHQYRLGDEFIFDGAAFSGTICPSFAITVVPKMIEIQEAGPRYRGYLFYYPFLYAPLSVEDPDSQKYDGLGFKNIKDNYTEPKFHMANLAGSGTFGWPPREERITHKDVRLICPDYRTSVVAKIEAFDLSDKGRNLPFFRREMTILDRVLKKPGIEAKKILNEFSKEEIEGIYPALGQAMVEALLEEMELMGYVEIQGGKVSAGRKAGKKLDEFKEGLTPEERAALNI